MECGGRVRAVASLAGSGQIESGIRLVNGIVMALTHLFKRFDIGSPPGFDW